jgi:response regulator RpfG family c-di-GMP phosphodiesterase
MKELSPGYDSSKSAGKTLPYDGGSLARVLLQELMDSSLVLSEDWERLSAQTRDELTKCSDTSVILPELVRHGLLTEFQAIRVDAGDTFGLILGNYRVLDQLGAGGMGVIFKGEHVRLRKAVAIKVLPLLPGSDSLQALRFLREIRAVAQLQHPNIVSAIDCGETFHSGPTAPSLRYFVMEYVPGQDLTHLVAAEGPLAPDRACGLVYQVASALAEAHKHQLVHRDVKPSNIRVTPDDQAKLLDFGLVRFTNNRLTEPGMVFGTLDYLAPEQARDTSSVDIRADIYGLGGSLFWCLTGRTPFAGNGTPVQKLIRRLNQPPPSVRHYRPEIPAGLDAIVARMMACRPDDRYPTPQAVMNALLPFFKAASSEFPLLPSAHARATPRLVSPGVEEGGSPRVLVVDDDPMFRLLCTRVLGEAGMRCDQAKDGREALAAIGNKSYDLVVTDWIMPGLSGLDLCRGLRANPPAPNLKIILFSASTTDDQVEEVLAAGADDYLNKQFSPTQLLARVNAALRLKESQDRADLLTRDMLACNRQLEQNLRARDSDLAEVRNALVLGLADLVSYRDTETTSHMTRLQRYCRLLAVEAANLPGFSGQIDENFIRMLECCAPLHDIGKVGLPDYILAKPGGLDAEERQLMQAHTTIGAEALQRVAQRHGSAVAFLQMAIDIARSHHERYDGSGYPDRLTGNAIPLAARLVAIGDVYDSLRCRRAHKPALPHAAAERIIQEGAGGPFDPVLVQAFQRCVRGFENIFRELPEETVSVGPCGSAVEVFASRLAAEHFFQVAQGRRSVALGGTDPGQCEMGLGGMGTEPDGVFQVRRGLRVVLQLVVQQTSVQGAFGQVRVEFEGPVIILEGRFAPTKSGVGQCTVVEAFGAPRRQGHANRKGSERLVMAPQAIPADALVEVAPEIPWLEVQSCRERRRCFFQAPGAQQ